MKITDVETYILRVPTGETFGDARSSVRERYWVVVELETDVGLRGTGWLGTWRIPELFEQYLTDTFTDLLVGRNPHETETIRQAMREQTLYYPGELGMSANPRGAIDVALWDLKAQAADEPLYRYLGGDDPEVPVYISRMDAHHDREDLATLHGDYADRGFTAFKTKVGNRSPQEEARRVETVREAVGPDADLMVDANQTWSPAEAVEHVERLATHDITWVEEPVSAYDFDAYERVAGKIATPIATGEMFYRRERFAHLLSHGAADVVQPDLIRGGGITGQLDVARLADAHGVRFAPHIYYPVSAHVVSAVSSGWMVEYIPEYDAGTVLANAPAVADGHVHLSDEPGHGYHVTSDAKAEYRYDPSVE